MDQPTFLRYIDHFNHKRYEEVMAFYDPDVVIEYPTMLSNPQAQPVTGADGPGFSSNTSPYTSIAAKPLKSKPS